MSSANAAPGRSYTTAQEDVVRRVLRCKANEHYAILDVQEDANADEIKRAFKTLALLLHPDKNAAPGAEDAFKRVRQASDILGDAQERAAYDDARRGGFASFFSSYSTPADEYTSQAPRSHKKQPRRNETRKQRRQREYQERLARQRERQEELRQAQRAAEAEELLRQFAREAGRRGLKFWYCRECDDVHLEGEVHVQGSTRTSRASSADAQRQDGIFEALLTLIVIAAGVLLLLYALYYGAKLLFTSTVGKILLGLGGIVTVLYFLPDPTPTASTR